MSALTTILAIMVAFFGTSVHYVPRNHRDEFKKHVKGV